MSMLRDGHVHHVVDVFQGRELHDLRDLLDHRDVALFLHRHLHDLVNILDLRDILGKNEKTVEKFGRNLVEIWSNGEVSVSE